MSAMLTADWCPLGKDSYFRKFEIYSMPWHQEVNLDEVLVAAAPYGGPIAIIRDRKKFVKIQGATNKSIIFIYSSSGKQIGSIIWTSGQLVHFGWSSSEELLCVQEDGCVLIYDMFGNHQHTFGMGQEEKVLDAKIFNSNKDTGIAVLTASFRIFLVNKFKDPKVRQLAEIPVGRGHTIPPSSWLVISEDRYSKVLLSRDKELFWLKQSEQQAIPILHDSGDLNKNVLDMAVSQNNKYIALFLEDGKLWVGSSDLKKKLWCINTKFSSLPKQLVWCGTEAITINCEKSVFVYSRFSGDENITYSYDSTCHLIPEMDGIRIITAFNHEMIQKVPEVVQKIYRINSTEPGSYLLEASKQFQKRNHRADEYIRLVKEQLETAVTQCIDAAGYEFDGENQKMLIKAAQFGKGFYPGLNSDAYVKTCRILRVLNAVRHHLIGIPLTVTQLKYLTIQVLMDRLVLRRHYPIAIEIAKYLKLPDLEGTSRILAHWACFKVNQTQLDKDQVARDIASKLGYAPGVSYSEIAIKAADSGRPQLAIKLLEYETKARLQVPLLLKFGENKPALMKAIESGDTDLVYTVLLRLRENMPLGEFQMAIRNYPVAQALYLKYCRDNNKETLKDIYVQEDDFNAQAACYIRDGYDIKFSSTKEASLSGALESYKRARNDANSTLVEEQLKLSSYQRSLTDKFGRECTGLSVSDTIAILLSMNEVKLADKLRTEYKVPDRRYWWLRILSLAELADWNELEKFSKSKKSPIGYEPFVDVCIKFDNKYEGHKYLARVKEELKVKYYIKLELFDDAAAIAYEQKDIQALLYAQSRCPPSQKATSEKINLLITQLSSKK